MRIVKYTIILLAALTQICCTTSRREIGAKNSLPIEIEPQYPKDALLRGINGCVKYEFMINAQGKAENIRVVKSYPEEVFDASGLLALKRSTFEPNKSNPDSFFTFTYMWIADHRETPHEVSEHCTGKKYKIGKYTSKAVSSEDANDKSSNDAKSIARSFEVFWSAAHGKQFAAQLVLWNRYIERPREKLYRSVVWEVRDNPNWIQAKARGLKTRFSAYQKISGKIPEEARAIRSQIRAQAIRFGELFPNASTRPAAVLVLAPFFDSKSGVLPDGTPVLALAVDTLLLEKANLKILLPHELFHLYDAEAAGVKNDGVMPGTTITLPLFAEGLATYVSTIASPGYTDGEYLLQQSLGALPDSSLKMAARRFLADADTLTINQTKHKLSPIYARWFEGSKSNLQPGLPNRAGYWLGLHLIRQLRHHYSLQEIASWPPARAQKEMRIALRVMAHSSLRNVGNIR